jgi:mannonate dehydratase
MKLGFGLYSHMLNASNYAFARQAGATHIVAHLTDYFYKGDEEGSKDQPLGNIERGWGYAVEKEVWSTDRLVKLKDEMQKFDLKLEALENISPAFWHDILLDGPKREEQIKKVKQLIQNMGEAGIPILGYNFALAGVSGRTKGPYARGNAEAVGMEGISEAINTPIPNGMVWNMIYDPNAPEGIEKTISYEELIRRYKSFISEMLPVAEKAGVQLALHPDDPPLKEVRQQPRLGYHPEHYKKLIKLEESPNHVMELCIGTLGEMVEGDLYEAVEYFAENHKIGYLHCRNIRNKVPYYKETFVDEGEIDIARILRILKKHDFQGVIIPDHAPQMSCEAPWHAGMAYAMGYLKGLMQLIEKEKSTL